MRANLYHARMSVLLLLVAILVGCGGSGDEYDGFDGDLVGLQTPDQYLRFFNQQQGDLDDTNYARAYNAAVDPGTARGTLQDYIALHGLDTPDVHVIFRDTKDLGYGRDMYMRSYSNASVGSTCGPAGAVTIAFYVRNFSVQIVEGFAYGPVNLEAAIAEDLKHHVGTNAIEFGYGRDDVGDNCSPEPMTKFFTFEPDGTRRERVDLDGRGAKAMPQPCVSCHGGKLRPLDRNGNFVAIHADDPAEQIGDVKARLQAFEVDTFEFSETPGYRRADLEEGLRKLNAAIYCTYPGSWEHAACATDHGKGVEVQTNKGEWSGDFAREMMLGWYGNTLESPGSKFDGDFVPEGWKPSPSTGGPPTGTDVLFTKVVGPNCFVCHGKQGVQFGTNENAEHDSKDLDFETWEKFISYADDIERLVFDEGRMPLGLLNYQTFWDDPQKADLLASFIAPYVTDPTGFKTRRTNSNGTIIMPGRIVARAGPDRVTRPGAAITLDAQASLFADSYLWELVSSPALSVVSIASPNAVRTDFSADTVGEYVVNLTASTSNGDFKVDTLTIVVDDALLPAPRTLAFYNDITDEFTMLRPVGGSGRTCKSCHQEGGIGIDGGPPMWWTLDATQPFAVPPTAPWLGLYEVAMTRVMPDYIEDSLLLKKPSGWHHYGYQVDGFDTSLPVGAAGRASYDKIVNWIAEGATCGMGRPECP